MRAGGARSGARPQRAHAIAPFAKFTGPSPTLQPWQDGVVTLDGAAQHSVATGGVVHAVDAHAESRPLVERCGLVAACAAMATGAPPAPVATQYTTAARGASGVQNALRGAAPQAQDSLEGAHDGATEGELKRKLEEAQAEVKRWKGNYMEMFSLAQDAARQSES